MSDVGTYMLITNRYDSRNPNQKSMFAVLNERNFVITSRVHTQLDVNKKKNRFKNVNDKMRIIKCVETRII